MQFKELFPSTKPVIACIHLMPLPGAPKYSGNMEKIFDTALRETKI
ncbi:MAG: hypothetical protein K8R68_12120, partial [Bacteroidales bacterium]|nr:hypothetical protein [Bacteroidales bacterium]